MIRGSYESLIFELRGYKVMVDSDLAALYEKETNQLVTNCDRLSSLKHSSIYQWCLVQGFKCGQ